MARSTSLSEEAFRALRAEKRPGESDSDVILRLRREARAKRKDPMRFLRRKPNFAFPEKEYDRILDKMRAADRRDAWRE